MGSTLPMKMNELPTFQFHSKVWLYSGKAAWHFVTLPKGLSADLKKQFGGLERGWGSIRVLVKIGKTQWKTSVFPDKKAGAYLLPLKAEARKAGEFGEGDKLKVEIGVMI